MYIRLFYSILAGAPDQNEPHDQYACCACGGATYDITFMGKRSFLFCFLNIGIDWDKFLEPLYESLLRNKRETPSITPFFSTVYAS